MSEEPSLWPPSYGPMNCGVRSRRALPHSPMIGREEIAASGRHTLVGGARWLKWLKRYVLAP